MLCAVFIAKKTRVLLILHVTEVAIRWLLTCHPVRNTKYVQSQLTIDWKNLTWMSRGSLITDRKLLHMSALNCSHQVALYGEDFFSLLSYRCSWKRSRLWLFWYATSAKMARPARTKYMEGGLAAVETMKYNTSHPRWKPQTCRRWRQWWPDTRPLCPEWRQARGRSDQLGCSSWGRWSPHPRRIGALRSAHPSRRGGLRPSTALCRTGSTPRSWAGGWCKRWSCLDEQGLCKRSVYGWQSWWRHCPTGTDLSTVTTFCAM